MEEYNLSMGSILLASKNEQWSREKACEESKPFIDTFKFCNSQVRRQSIIPLELVYGLVKLIKPSIYSDRGVIEIHNTACADHPDALIN